VHTADTATGQAEVNSPCSTQRAVQPTGVTCTTIRRRQWVQ